MESSLDDKIVVIRSLSKDKFNGISRHAKTVFTLTTELGDGGFKTGLKNREEEIHYEKALGLTEGTLSRKSVFWAELETKMPAKQLKLNLADPMNQLRYKAMLASSKVANSQLEIKKWPMALYVIVDEQAESEAESIIIDKEIEAMEKFSELSVEAKRSILKLYGKRGVDEIKESLVKTTLHKEIKLDPTKFIEICEDKTLKTKSLIYDLVEYGILTKVKNYYKDGDEVIGNSIEEAVSFLDSPKNNTIKAALSDKLSRAKKKAIIV